MKRLFHGAILFVAAASAAPGAGVRTVYILPMPGGLDLYLAEWLARGKAVRVTTDPAHADAVLTDRLGEDFERKLDEIAPGNDDEDDSAAPSARYGAGRNRGTVFLVDVKTRQVLWSDYEKPPAYRSSSKLHHEAGKIAKKLTADLSK